jgi:pimeloyl-ACP methyl ester carboxylesterase
MTIALVHGVPEDLHIWDDLRAELPDRETVALGMPGFGTALPAGFAATKEGYLAWLCDELAQLPGPIDLVGHDWGGILTMRLALTRPDLIRSFVTDAIGFIHPSFTWHDLARVWATPGAGEKFMAEQAAAPIELRIATFTGFGVSPHYARRMAVSDPVKSQCILDLYRSAIQIQVEWGTAAKPPERPGLLLLGAKDPFGAPAKSAQLAQQLGMTVKILDDVGHFWPSQAPAAGAAALRDYWATL